MTPGTRLRPSRVAMAVLALGLLMACDRQSHRLPESLVQLRESLPRHPGADVIVISFDALRADVVGAYGYPRRTTPNMDAFADRAMLMERAYTVAPVTPTSFAAALTGLLPMRVFQGWKLVAEHTLVADFGAAGYHTAAVFNSVQLTPERNFDRGFDEYLWSRNAEHEEALEAALDWFRSNPPEPFFIWIHALPPHAPYVRRDLASHLYDTTYQGQYRETSGEVFDSSDQADIARLRDLYDGNVFYADWLFGQLLALLEDRGYLERSVVVLTADHGEELHDHGRFQHGRLYEEHVRIPLLIYHPDVRKASRSDVLYANVDLLPTLLDIVGSPATEPLDGRDLLAVEQEPSVAVGISMTGGHERYASVTDGVDRLILSCLPERRVDLYDLASDPGETTDLSDRARPRVRELADYLARVVGGEPCATMTAAISGKARTSGLDEESLEALRALGYLSD